MILLEIAAQGVRGFAPARGRAVLRPGYNVLPGEGSALRLLVGALLHPEHPFDPALRPEGAAGGAARTGLTFTGDDGSTWRVVRDLGAGFQLQRYDLTLRAFQAVPGSPGALAERLLGAGLPAPRRLALLSIDAGEFPSRRPPGRGGVPARGGRASESRDVLRRRVETLRDELARAHGAVATQERIESLQQAFFRLEDVVRAGDALRSRVAEAAEMLAPFASASAALASIGDVPAAIAGAERATARRDEALARIAEEMSAQHAPGIGWRALTRSPGFVGGLGLGAVALLLGATTRQAGLALLAIPATGWAALEGLRWVSRAEAAEAGERRTRVLSERERKVREAWERETASVRDAMVATGVATIAELRDLWERIVDARGVRTAAEEELAAWSAAPENRDAEEERAQVQREIGELEAELTGGNGGFLRDAVGLEQEIARIEREMETGPFAPVAVEAGEAGVTTDGFRALVERCSNELALTPGEAMRAAQQRILQLLPAVSGQRLASFLLDAHGTLQVQSGGRLVPARELGPAEQDACFAVLSLSLLELALAGGRHVALVDDAFGALPEGSRRVLARGLREIARGRQVVHGTTDPVFREAADGSG